MTGVERRAGFVVSRRVFVEPRSSTGRPTSFPEDARRGAIPGGDAGLALLEGVVHVGQALEGVGVAPGCDTGV